MSKESIFQFISAHRYAVQASVSAAGTPQAALVGIAVKPSLEIIFDTVSATRKYQNLLLNPHIALVIGEGEQTVQYEGVARVAAAEELEMAKEIYFQTFPSGTDRLVWPGITYFIVQPVWIRFSDFSGAKLQTEELNF